jgi:hypothetical protein
MSTTPTPAEAGAKIIQALKHFQGTMDARYELFEHQSRILRMRYLMRIDRGFTAEQALYLCDKDWSNAV